MLGVGIIGGGRIRGAREHGAAGPGDAAGGDRGAGRAATLGLRGTVRVPVYAETGTLLDQPDVDAVVVALPHWLHCDAAVAALRAGKHVLLEKPMAMTVAECDRILAAGREAGRVVMVGHHHHYVPVNQEARRMIRDGEIGSLVMGTDTWYKAFFSDPRPAWFLEADKGGGMWPMNGSHMIDRLTFLSGSRVVAVKAKIGSPIFGHSATDTGIAFLQFESGFCATIMHAGYRDGVQRFEAEITGTEGQLRFTGRELWRSREGEWAAVPVPDPPLPVGAATSPSFPAFYLEMQDFSRACREGGSPGVPGEYAREVVRVLIACEEASASGREVRLDVE